MQRLGRHSARLKELRRRIRRRPEGEVIVDGRRLLADVVRWEVALLEVYVAAGLAGDPEIEGWAATAGEAWQVEDDLFAKPEKPAAWESSCIMRVTCTMCR